VQYYDVKINSSDLVTSMSLEWQLFVLPFIINVEKMVTVVMLSCWVLDTGNVKIRVEQLIRHVWNGQKKVLQCLHLWYQEHSITGSHHISVQKWPVAANTTQMCWVICHFFFNIKTCTMLHGWFVPKKLLINSKHSMSYITVR
jgi:hypothetical protein